MHLDPAGCQSQLLCHKLQHDGSKGGVLDPGIRLVRIRCQHQCKRCSGEGTCAVLLALRKEADDGAVGDGTVLHLAETTGSGGKQRGTQQRVDLLLLHRAVFKLTDTAAALEQGHQSRTLLTAAQHSPQFLRGIHQNICTASQQHIGIPIAPCAGIAGHTAVASRCHVHLAVTHIHTVVAGHTQLTHGFLHHVGSGLFRTFGRLGNNHIHQIAQQLIAEAGGGQHRLVGDDRHAETVRLQALQQLDDAVIGASVGNMRRIVGTIQLQRFVQQFLRDVSLPGAAELMSRAVAHKITHFRHRAGSTTIAGKDLVGGRGDVLQGVQQRTVQIKKNGFSHAFLT